MPCEFDCAECGRHVFNFGGRPTVPPLCALCLALPGWFQDPDLRRSLDPEHDGRERGFDHPFPTFFGELP